MAGETWRRGKTAGAVGNIEERELRSKRGPKAKPVTVYRVRWACQACTIDALEGWERDCRKAEAEDSPRPPKPTIRHRSPWDPSRAKAQAIREEIAAEQERYRTFGWAPLCYWDDHFSDGGANDRRTFAPVLDVFAQRVLSREGAPTTLMDDRRHYEEKASTPGGEPLGIQARFGWTPIDKIERSAVRQWLTETKARPGAKPGTTYSPSQVRQRFYLLRRCFREAVADGVLAADPTNGLEREVPRLPQGRAVTGLLRAEKDRRWLPTETELRELLEAVEPRSKLAVALLFAAGMRVGEVVPLERADLREVEPDRWEVAIFKSESASHRRAQGDTKNHRGAIRQLPVWVGPVIEEHFERVGKLEPSARLFPAVGSKKAVSLAAGTIRGDLAAACVEAGKAKLTPHDLRAAGEASVAERIGRPDAARWARHSLAISMAHYVAMDEQGISRSAAGWE